MRRDWDLRDDIMNGLNTFIVQLTKNIPAHGSQEQEVWYTLPSPTTYFGIIGSLEHIFLINVPLQLREITRTTISSGTVLQTMKKWVIWHTHF